MKDENLGSDVGTLSHEMRSADFGSKRLSDRFAVMVESVMKKPKESFPEIFESEAEQEAAYRWLRNPRVTLQKAIEPHLSATCERMIKAREVLIIHDSSFCQFTGEQQREGLCSPNHTKAQGFFLHLALAISADESQTPLGVAGLETFSRVKKRANLSKSSEGDRWARLVETVETRIADNASAIHVMDREGDSYERLDQFELQARRFVIRLSHDRPIRMKSETSPYRISEALERLSSVYEREVPLSRRSKVKRSGDLNRKHPARTDRIAKLQFSATTLTVKRPKKVSRERSPFLKLNIVHVHEVDPPTGEAAVDWKLITTESIDTTEDILRIVDIYRKRWLIEEYFKALKSGCSYELRQLESLKTLLNALGLLLPVAWRLLLMRNLSRTQPHAPAKMVLTKTQLAILRAIPKLKLPAEPTVEGALLTVARLGGHIKQNGPPGWQVLGRGYQKLLMYEVGWNTAKYEQENCDQ